MRARLRHPVRGTFLCQVNRRCKARHVLQRPPENNTCLHTVSSHNTLPMSELVPFRFHRLARLSSAATRQFAPSCSSSFPPSPLPTPLVLPCRSFSRRRCRRRSRPASQERERERNVSRVLSRRCKSLSAVGVIANLRRPVGSVQNDRFLFNPFTTIVACPVEEDAGIAAVAASTRKRVPLYIVLLHSCLDYDRLLSCSNLLCVRAVSMSVKRGP